MFWRVVWRRPVSGFVWGELPPGRYRLRAHRRNMWGEYSHGPDREAVGEPIDVEVHQDGSCTPAVV